jgi:hypothetical protein
MARFLSSEWFDEVVRRGPQPPDDHPEGPLRDLVLEQVVRDTPEGVIRYLVVVSSGLAYVVPGGVDRRPDLTVTCDWATAVAMAQGELSAQSALMEGRLRVKGDLGRLADHASELTRLDPLPDEVRRQTTY